MNKHYILKQRYLIILVFTMIFGGRNLFAQTQYIGASGGEWHNPANWNNGLPAAGNNANIFGNPTVNVNQSLTIDFTIQSFGTINFNSPIINNGSVQPSGGVSINSDFINNGEYKNLGGTTTVDAAGSFDNRGSGTLIIQNGDFVSDASFTNSGAVTVNTTFANNGGFTNNGSVTIQGTFDNNSTFDHEASANLSINNGAHFNNPAGSTLNTKSGSTTQIFGFLDNDGTAINNGSITNDGFVTNNGLYNNNNGGLIHTKKEFNNNGVFNNNNNAIFRITVLPGVNNGEFINNGTFDNQGDFTNTASGIFTNNSSLINANGTDFDNYGIFITFGELNTVGRVQNFGTMTNNGNVTAPNGGNLTNEGTLVNNNFVTNLQMIINNGTMLNDGRFENGSPGTLVNNGDFTNALGGFIANDFDLTNNDQFQNIGTIENGVRIYNNGTFDNNGVLNNIGCFSNAAGATLNNDKLNGVGGVIDNLAMGYITNAGTFNNSNEVFINECSSLVNEQGGVINNSYWFTIDGLFWNFQPGQPNNTGAGGVFYNGFTISGATSSDICEDITASVDNNGNALILGTSIAKSSLDNCGAFILEVDNQNFSCTGLGQNQVTLTLSHKTQTVDCTATVTIVDDQNPTLTSCPNDILVTTSTGSAPATWGAPNASDNCSVTLSSTHNSGDIFPLGMTTVTYTAVDQSGNVNSCAFKVTVVADGDCADVVSARKVLNTKTNCGTGANYVMWLQGGVRYTAGDDMIFVEYNNGTALLTGSIYKNGQRGYIEVMYMGFSSNAPSGSPKTDNCVSNAASDWKYYTSMSGYFTMENGVTCDITRRGPAFQFGTGANLQEGNKFGGSGWFDTNENTVGDFNFNLGNTITCQNSIYLEAECANAVGSKWSVVNDGNASNGQALVPPSGQISYNNPPTSSADLLTYNVSVVQGGKYRLYFRSIAPNGSADSYWVQVNNGAWTKWNKVNSDNYSSSYQWDIVGQWDGGYWDIPNTFQLNPGSNTIKVSWREPGLKLDKIFVTYIGKRPTGQGEAATNCSGTTPPPPPPATCNQTALFVVGRSSLNNADWRIKNRLQNLGYTVTVKDDDYVQTSHANGKGIIVISSSVYSGKVNTKFKHTAVPVVVWEQWLFDDMRMTGNSSSNYGTWSSTNKIHITNANHPITSGYTGDLQVLTANKTIGWGMPVGGGVSLGHVPGVPQKSMLFAYDTGAQMNGMTAPARRVGMFMRNSTPNCFNNNGWLLFDAVISWAADCNLISPYISNDDIQLQAQATNDRKVNLAWTFNKAYTTEFMTLQKSTDNGETFETMNEWYVWEEENTDTKTFLETDLTPIVGENLYRIKLVSLNGAERFSNIPVIEFVDIVDFAVFPNPATDFVEINLEKLVGAKEVNITITDWTGRSVQETQIDEVVEYTERIELNNYRSGTYAITITTEGKRPVTRKLIIAK